MNSEPIRVMSWNFLEGGCHRLPLEHGPVEDAVRMTAARALMDKYTPDIVVLNEALWSRDFQGHARDYARLFGYEYSSAHLYDRNWGNVLLSRFPIEDMVELRIYNREGFVATVHTSLGLLQVGTYHPHPSRFASNKRKDFKRIVGLFDEDLPGLLAGDFNMISPHDAPDLDRLEKGFSRFSKTPRADAQRFIDAGQWVVPTLEQMGWHDAIPVARRQYTIPTRLLTPNPSADGSAMRIDHMWSNPHCLVLDAGPLHDELADQSSDHYPLLACVNF